MTHLCSSKLTPTVNTISGAFRRVCDIGGRAGDIIRIACLPLGKLNHSMTMRATVVICPRARCFAAETGIQRHLTAFSAFSGSVLVSKPGSFFPSAEVYAVRGIRPGIARQKNREPV